MAGEDSKQLAMRMAALAQHLERESAAGTRQLEEAARGLGESARQAGRELTAIIRGETAAAAAQGVGQAANGFSDVAQQAARAVRDAAHALGVESDRLRRGQRLWVLVAMGALTAGSLLAVGGSAYVLRNHKQQLARVEYQLELQRLSQAGVFVRCGEALCARIGERPAWKDGDGHAYVVLSGE